jgi:sterol 3beta-glucosyltransferase
VRITILTAGSRGDVQPYVALGVALKRAGYQVCLPAPQVFRTLITEHNLEYVPAKGVSPQDFINRPEIQAALRTGSLLQTLRMVLREAGPLLTSAIEAYWEGCQGADAIISTMAFFGAVDSAEKLGVPCIHSLLTPSYPTSAFPSPFFGINNAAIFNRLTHVLLDQIWWQAFRMPLNRWRKKMGMPSQPFLGPYATLRSGRIPILFGYSPSVLPKPADWPAWNHVSGYWFLDELPDWQPPVALVRFLEAGPPPVYIGFGSMLHHEPEHMTHLMLEALRLSGQRGVLLSGWSGLSTLAVPDTVFGIDSIPHAWLFPRTAAVVHHGGAGTTGAALRAGVPVIITPFLGDQVFWAHRIVQLGAGPHVSAYNRLTAEKLAAAIQIAVTDQSMQACAAALGEKIRAEDGVGQAVTLIQKYLGKAGIAKG